MPKLTRNRLDNLVKLYIASGAPSPYNGALEAQLSEADSFSQAVALCAGYVHKYCMNRDTRYDYWDEVYNMILMRQWRKILALYANAIVTVPPQT